MRVFTYMLQFYFDFHVLFNKQDFGCLQVFFSVYYPSVHYIYN